MRRLLVDTNIIIDVLARREPFFQEAAGLFTLADKRVLKLSTSALTIANTSYTLLKQMDAKSTKAILRKLRLIIDVIPLDDKIISLALNDDKFNDFEDGLQYFSALEYNQEIIITRNLKDFKKSTLPVMTAGQYLETLS